MSQVLYRKYRPKTFSEMVGQEYVKRVLKNAIREGNVSHAYIFSGPRGTGKTSCARILAKSLNCLNPHDGEPCNKCENCREIDSGSFMDVIEMDAASNRGIDEIRKIRDRVSYLPAKGKVKVYIIDEFHMLTREAFNALLKTLEEPPPHVLFILATTNLEKVPETILSRCQIFDFKLIPDDLIFNHLKSISEKEKISITNDALKLIAEKASGSLRDSLAILEQIQRYSSEQITQEHVREILGVVPKELVRDFIDSLLKKDFDSLFKITERLVKENKSLETFILESIENTLQSLKEKDGLYEKYGEKLVELANRLTNLLKDVKYTEEKVVVFEVGALNVSKELSENRAVEDNVLDVENTQEATKNRVTKPKEEEDEKIEKLKNYLLREGDLDLWVALVYAKISKQDKNIILEYDKNHNLHFEIVREKLEELQMLYKMINNEDVNFSPVYLEEEISNLSEESVKILKKVLSIFPGKVRIEKRGDQDGKEI